MVTAKVFWSGRSQAARLPKEYRFQTTEVRIRRQGPAVMFEPIATDRAWLDQLEPFDDDFVRAANEQPPEQHREEQDCFKRSSFRTPTR
jgi:antitoxin VapB